MSIPCGNGTYTVFLNSQTVLSAYIAGRGLCNLCEVWATVSPAKRDALCVLLVFWGNMMVPLMPWLLRCSSHCNYTEMVQKTQEVYRYRYVDRLVAPAFWREVCHVRFKEV